MLSDKGFKISKSYGVLRDDGCTWRAMFMIDNNLILRQITINDLPTGRSTDEATRLIKSIQYSDKHGEALPLNMIANQEKKQG